jgi:type IV pilus assembly protein PilQ
MKQRRVETMHCLGIVVVTGFLAMASPPEVRASETAVDDRSPMSAMMASADLSGRQAAPVPARVLKSVETRVDGDNIAIVISGDGPFVYTSQAAQGRRLIFDIANVQSVLAQPQQVVGHTLLKRIRFGHHVDKVRMVLDLDKPSRHTVASLDGGLMITLKPGDPTTSEGGSVHESIGVSNVGPDKGYVGLGRTLLSSNPRVLVSQRSPKALLRARTVQMTGETDVKKEEKNNDEPASEVVTGQSRYVGRRISLDFQQADISNVLRLIAEVSGFNIVVGEGVKNKVTMKLANVPWDQALDMLLKMNGLGMIRQGNIVWVDTLMNIAKQQDEEARAKESKVKAEPIVTRVFYIRNLNAQEVQQSLRQYISPRGVINSSQASNALIVSDAESRIAVMRQLVEGLDLEVPQVQIEARIVQADTTYTRSLGVQWGIQNINQMGSSSGTAAFRTGTTGSFGAQVSDFLVNLPATAGFSPVPGAGFTIGKTDGALLDVRLSAGELLGLTKVIAAPKVTTLDKRDAKIAQGESIPFQTTSLQGTQTTFVDANLELNVTPQITSRDPQETGKRILMKVRATRNAVGARSNPAGPSIDRREATTQVLVRDGETMVIGGVFVDTQNNTVAGIPYLSRVPVLGWLFKQKTENVTKQELLIFLTPTIVKS